MKICACCDCGNGDSSASCCKCGESSWLSATELERRWPEYVMISDSGAVSRVQPSSVQDMVEKFVGLGSSESGPRASELIESGKLGADAMAHFSATGPVPEKRRPGRPRKSEMPS